MNRIAFISGFSVVLGFGSTIALQLPGQAQSATFFCGSSSNGIPTTYATTPRGQVAVVRWTSEYFTGAGYNPMVRCQEVSSRFERHRVAGNLNFITAGYLNGQPAICAGNGAPPCTSDKLLFTLKPGSNAAARIQQLFNIRSGASATPLYESTRPSSGSAGESGVVDMNQFLQNAPIEVATPSNPASTAPSTNPAPSGNGGLLF